MANGNMQIKFAFHLEITCQNIVQHKIHENLINFVKEYIRDEVSLLFIFCVETAATRVSRCLKNTKDKGPSPNFASNVN